ncbi:SAM-dependent methyltransferase [Dactylosporangium sp. CA-139066]|uniref:SAM-dependent methyltransferase n=1 Tax=Dactylosporangium sp. CA-139066 TaxID=3239930 RepID=UPI003D8CF6E9
MIHTARTVGHRQMSYPAQPGTWIRDDLTRPPTVAGFANAMYGGFYNQAVDRHLVADIAAAWPPIRDHMLAGRAAQGRIVRYLLDAGVEQFLDIGAGIARHGATHDIIAAAISDENLQLRQRPFRVVYVDIDPITTTVNRSLLEQFPWAAAVGGDLQHPATILNNDVVNDLLDFGRPVAVLLLGVLHHVPHRPGRVVQRLAEALSYGSYLAISHLTTDPNPAGAAAQRHAADLLAATPTPLYLRHPAHVAALLRDPRLPAFTLAEPGYAPADQWRPDPDDEPPFPAPHLLTAVAELTPPARHSPGASR